jgi:polyhydroxybutyrate depolymerase
MAITAGLLLSVHATVTGGAAAQTGEPTAGSPSDLTVRTPDGRDRTARIYVPAALPPDERAPLLVALHGGTGWGAQFELTSDYDRLADEHGFIVVYPDGIGIGPNTDQLRTWNGGICCGPAMRQGVDDVGFLRTLVETIARDHRIDADRVYATGHSNGMIMSYRLLCEAADVFVAAAGQAGTLGVDDCQPSRPVSLRHIHGSADTNLPIDGGRGTGISNVDFPSPRTGLRMLARANGCPRAATTTTRGPASTRAWEPCDGNTTVELVTVDGANHAWMGAVGRVRPNGPQPFADYDSSVSSWKFLATHPRRG